MLHYANAHANSIYSEPSFTAGVTSQKQPAISEIRKVVKSIYYKCFKAVTLTALTPAHA